MRWLLASTLLFPLLLWLLACTGCRRSSPTAPPADTTAATDTPFFSRYILADAVCDYQPDETALLNSGWTKTFEDHFTEEGDLSLWQVWTGGAYNNELQHYQPANIRVAGGMLSISARKETVSGAVLPGSTAQKSFAYTSGRIECSTSVSAGPATPKVRMAARIKLPKGYGLWPAFWSYGEPWPAQGEIDVMEARGQEPDRYQTNYFYGPDSNLVRRATGYILADEDLSRCFHVYELVWTQNALTSYLDGKQIEVNTRGGYIPALFGKTHRLVLNLAVGGSFFKTLDTAQIETGTLQVDWVKVYTAQ